MFGPDTLGLSYHLSEPNLCKYRRNIHHQQREIRAQHTASGFVTRANVCVSHKSLSTVTYDKIIHSFIITPQNAVAGQNYENCKIH